MVKFNFKNYFKEARFLLEENKDNFKKLELISNLFLKCQKKNNKVIIIGNGGSASTASHVSVDLSKLHV